jgi:O-acetyl-ADP-ribose deacetylase
MDIDIVLSDITELRVDAIVNAANCSLLGGGGVDGAIHRKAGPKLLMECRKTGGCSTGAAVMTNGYNLPSTYVIHTVGPVWHGGGYNERQLLSQCYFNSLSLADKNKLKTIVFPAISAGVYRFPAEIAARIAVSSVREWKGAFPQKVIFCCFSHIMENIYKNILFVVS